MNEEYWNWIHNPPVIENETEARDEGYRAYQDGMTSNDNPFNNNEEWELHLAWNEGYYRAAWDD